MAGAFCRPGATFCYIESGSWDPPASRTRKSVQTKSKHCEIVALVPSRRLKLSPPLEGGGP